MFCPQCGASNERDQKFCRQCGQALTAVRLATEGRVDEALEKLKKGADSLAAGAINLAIFSSFAFVVTLLATIFDAPQGPWPILNIVIGLAIGIPLTVRGIIRLGRWGINGPRERQLARSSHHGSHLFTARDSRLCNGAHDV